MTGSSDAMSPHAATYLITGASGFLGTNLRRQAPPQAAVVGTSREVRPDEPTCTWESVDLTDLDVVEQLFERHRFSAVVHAAGEANVDKSAADPMNAFRSNVATTANLAHACASRQIHLIYVSTNAVYAGDAPPYAEDAPALPVNVYGRIKLASEFAALAINPQTTIARPILMYGWPTPGGRSNPVDFVITRLSRGENIKMVTDVRENPLLVDECARALWRMLDRRFTGVVNLAGATEVNRYDLALEVADVFDLDESLIESVDSSAFASMENRPPNTTFDTTKMRTELGVEPLPLRDGLLRMRTEQASA